MAEEGQQHPLKIYWIMWTSLFVLSGMSYATDFMNDGALRHFLILLFMFMKAGGIVLIFMHMAGSDSRSSLRYWVRLSRCWY